MKRKSILITGAGSGIGKDSAFALAQRGHAVIATTETENQSVQLQNDADLKELDITTFKLDITDPHDRDLIRDHSIDVLINNAAIGESGSLAEIDMNRVRQNFETNVFSTFEISQIALQKMLQQDSGSILFISSLAGRVAMPFLGPYSMTKFALSSGAETMRNEVKRISKNIHISLIEPGVYHTGFNQRNIARKYEWMDESSMFYHIMDSIKQEEERNFRFTEMRSTKGIVGKIVKAAESNNPKLRYSAPWWQALGVHIWSIEIPQKAPPHSISRRKNTPS